jgi:sterol 3beta-glucosyltransferase
MSADVHEGAETPLVGAVAAVAGFATTLGMNTTDFSDRLQRPTQTAHGGLVAAAKRSESSEVASHQHPHPNAPSSGQLENMAQRMAKKTFEENLNDNLNKPAGRQSQTMARLRTQDSAKRAKRGRVCQITSATAHYVDDVSRTCLRGKFCLQSGPTPSSRSVLAPVALFYNVANGFRNLPSYTITNEPHRRRDEITGIGSGLSVAGKVSCHINLRE